MSAESFVKSPIVPDTFKPGANIVSPLGVEALNGQVFQESPLEQDPKIVISQKLTDTIADNSSAILQYRSEYKADVGSLRTNLQNHRDTGMSTAREAREIIESGSPIRRSGVIVDFGHDRYQEERKSPQSVGLLLVNRERGMETASAAKKAVNAAKYRNRVLKQWQSYFDNTLSGERTVPGNAKTLNSRRALYQRKEENAERQLAQAEAGLLRLPQPALADLERKRNHYRVMQELIGSAVSQSSPQERKSDNSQVESDDEKLANVRAEFEGLPSDDHGREVGLTGVLEGQFRELDEQPAVVVDHHNGRDPGEVRIVEGEVVSFTSVNGNNGYVTREQLLAQRDAAVRVARMTLQELTEGDQRAQARQDYGNGHKRNNKGGLRARIIDAGRKFVMSDPRKPLIKIRVLPKTE